MWKWEKTQFRRVSEKNYQYERENILFEGWTRMAFRPRLLFRDKNIAGAYLIDRMDNKNLREECEQIPPAWSSCPDRLLSWPPRQSTGGRSCSPPALAPLGVWLPHIPDIGRRINAAPSILLRRAGDVYSIGSGLQGTSKICFVYYRDTALWTIIPNFVWAIGLPEYLLANRRIRKTIVLSDYGIPVSDNLKKIRSVNRYTWVEEKAKRSARRK